MKNIILTLILILSSSIAMATECELIQSEAIEGDLYCVYTCPSGNEVEDICYEEKCPKTMFVEDEE
jgi:hypothetical protein